jgi:hypothetical protein
LEANQFLFVAPDFVFARQSRIANYGARDSETFGVVSLLLFPNLIARSADRILHVAPGFLSLALYFLSEALDLGVGVACPFANLAPGAPGNFVDRALDSVLIN